MGTRGFDWGSAEERRQADSFFEEMWDLPAVRAGEAMWPDGDLRRLLDTWPPMPMGDEADASDDASVEEDFGWAEAPAGSTARDTTAAVTPFSAAERAIVGPLLDPAKTTAASQWNAAKHPSVSGLSDADLRAALADYVDVAAVQAEIERYDRSHADAPMGTGTLPFDSLLVQSIHQFQRKCYFDPARHTGNADASVLDSLGFVDRPGLRTNRRVNRTAQARLARQPVSRLMGGEMTARTWFRFILNPSFVGWTFVRGGNHATGIHLHLVRKLRAAERWLQRRRNLQGSTPVALGRSLNFDETSEIHRGFRPSASGTSFHTFGLALDVKYRTNPFVRGADFGRTIRRAAKLVSGTTIPGGRINRYLHSLGVDPNRTTGAIYDILAGHDADFVLYMALPQQPETMRELLEQRKADGTAGVFKRGETIERAIVRWTKHARDDRAAMKLRSSPFRTNSLGLRDIDRGFLNMNRDFVIAMRDHACLAWGAVDLGPGSGGSGDVMHFDARVCGIGGRLPSGGQRKVERGHPCLPCVPPLLKRERGTSPPRVEARTLKRLTRDGSQLGPAPPRETLYVDIPLGREGRAKPMTGIFVPQHYRLPDSGEVDLILYLHGHKKGMRGFENSMSIDSYWNSQRFSGLWALREELNRSRRNAILVAPTLGASSQVGALEGTATTGGLDWFLGQVLMGLQVHGPLGPGNPPLALGDLILAAHSGGGSPMRKLARSGTPFAAKIRECWGFDSMYSSKGPAEWAQWTAANPTAKLFMYYRDVKHRPRKYGLQLRRKNVDNVTVEASRTNDHFKVVLERWRERIEGAPSLMVRPRAPIF